MLKVKQWLGIGLGLAGGLGLLRVRTIVREMTLARLALFPRVVGPRTPLDLELPFEEVWFMARDGMRLHGWYISHSPDRADAKNVTVVMGHGHTGNKEPDLEYARFFYRAGYNVFMFDFRGHGRSDGPRGSSMGYWERLDVHGAVDWLIGRGQERLAAFGISMGAAIMIMAAAENPFIRVVVSDSAFAHLYRSIAAEVNNMWGVPMWAARGMGYIGWRILADHHRFPRRAASPADYVAAIAPRPLLIIHGEEDKLTRIENAEILYKLAGQPKEFWRQPGISHVGGYVAYGPQYEWRILDFLDRVDWQQPLHLEAPRQTLDGIKIG